MGKILEDIGNDVRRKINQFAGIGTYFHSAIYREPSVSFPSICLSKRSSLYEAPIVVDENNFPLLVAPLRNQKIDIMGTSNFSTESVNYNSGLIDFTLSSSNGDFINDTILLSIIEYVYYHNGIDRGIPVSREHFDNVNLVIRINSHDLQITGVNLINKRIYAKDSFNVISSNPTSFEIFPYRLEENESRAINRCQIRKIAPETSLGSGLSANIFLENRHQGHWHSIYGYDGNMSDYIAGNTSDYGFLPDGIANEHEIGSPRTDNKNGTPRTGATTRGNILTTNIYIYGGKYIG